MERKKSGMSNVVGEQQRVRVENVCFSTSSQSIKIHLLRLDLTKHNHDDNRIHDQFDDRSMTEK